MLQHMTYRCRRDVITIQWKDPQLAWRVLVAPLNLGTTRNSTCHLFPWEMIRKEVKRECLLYWWFIWGRKLPVDEQLPIEFLIKPVVLYILGSSFEVTESLGQIGDEQMLNETLSSPVEVPGELYLTFKNFLINSHRVFVIKRINT